MKPNTAFVLAIAALSLADGAVGEYFFPGSPFPPSGLWFALGYITVMFAWYAKDSDQRGYKRSASLNVAIVALGAIAVPYYLFRTRGAAGGFLALGWLVLIGIGSMVLASLGAFASYYVLQR